MLAKIREAESDQMIGEKLLSESTFRTVILYIYCRGEKKQ